jgi:hypothetical protein
VNGGGRNSGDRGGRTLSASDDESDDDGSCDDGAGNGAVSYGKTIRNVLENEGWDSA